MLNKVEIEGYKSIKKIDLNLSYINILIGANGSGKSNFLSFFSFLKQIYNRNLQEHVALLGGTDSFLHKGRKITNEIIAKLHFHTSNKYSINLKDGTDSFLIINEGLWYDKNPNFTNPILISSLKKESNVRFNGTPRGRYINQFLNAIEKYHFHDTGANSPFNRSSNINTDVFKLYDKGDNIAAFLFHIQNNYSFHYNFIVKTIESVAPYFLDFLLQPNANGEVKLFWLSKNSSKIYSGNDLSDGTIRFIALAVLFLQPNLPETIIIDEPELGLHPFAINKLSGLIKSAAAKRCQIILATQSTDLLSHFNSEDIITVDQVNGESRFNRLDSAILEKWLEEYTIDDLWKRNIINGGQP